MEDNRCASNSTPFADAVILMVRVFRSLRNVPSSGRRLRSYVLNEQRLIVARKDYPAAAINTLPDEIVLAIFQCLVDDVRLADTSHPYQWIRVTHVCRRWRAVAISGSTLWSYVNTRGLPFLGSLLARSKTAPLIFDVDFNSTRRQPTVKNLGWSQFHRMRSYRLVGSDAVMRFLHYEHEHEPHALILHTLKLQAQGKTFIFVKHEWKSPLPALRELLLARLPVLKFSAIITSSLRRLDLIDAAPRLPASTVLALLDGLPALQALTLSRSVQSSPGILAEKRARSVTLRHLASLTLEDLQEDRHGANFYVLGSLACPKNVQLQFSTAVQLGHIRARAIEALDEHFANRFGEDRPSPIMDQCSISVWKHRILMEFPPPGTSMPLCAHRLRDSVEPLSVSFWWPEDMSSDDFDVICRYLQPFCSIEELRTVRVCAVQDVRLIHFQTMFQAMRNLERLSVSDTTVANQLLSIAAAVTPTHDDDLIFPRLELLIIHQKNGKTPWEDLQDDDVECEQLTLLLEHRRDVANTRSLLDVHFCEDCEPGFGRRSSAWKRFGRFTSRR